jgi:glutamate:GABA antiporter
LGVVWFFMDKPVQIHYNWSSFIPDFSSLSQLTLVSGLVLTIAGMEMSAIYANNLPNTQKQFPKAILIAALLIFSTYGLGSLSIASVIPKEQINLGSGTIAAFDTFFNQYHLSFLLPIMGILMTFGAIGMLNNWVLGPAIGLLIAAQNKELPAVFAKVNKNKMPVGILIIQGVLANILAIIILFQPSVNASYWIFYDLTAIFYLSLYVLLFLASIRLRYKFPNVVRTFKIPFGNVGIWIISGLGCLTVFLAILLGFIPPAQIAQDPWMYESFLFGGIILLVVAPILYHSYIHKK